MVVSASTNQVWTKITVRSYVWSFAIQIQNQAVCIDSLIFSKNLQEDHATILVCDDYDFNPVLTGIASFGPLFCGISSMPGVFTNIAQHYKWINETIATDIPPEAGCYSSCSHSLDKKK